MAEEVLLRPWRGPSPFPLGRESASIRVRQNCVSGRNCWKVEVECEEKIPFSGTVVRSSSLLDTLECSVCCGNKFSLCGCQEKAIIFQGQASLSSSQQDEARDLPHIISIHAV